MDEEVQGLLRIARTSGGWTMQTRKAFTLIELLVVISILTLLMAILLPTLQRVRKQARAVACQANLRQWGVAFSMYMNEHDGKLGCDEWYLPWWRWMHAYYANGNDLLLCPMATRYELNKNDPKWEASVTGGWGPGSKFTAWKATDSVVGRNLTLYGSYGNNLAAPITIYAQGHDDVLLPSSSHTPFFLDCATWTSYTTAGSEPPAYDGDLAYGPPPSSSSGVKYFCIDRHGGAINSLFLDWSVRKVGLKELWTLKWSGRYDTAGAWTRAGGVQPEDWPAWMRKFKDY
jgi:prepilin-type N-terminal cleavage/methylation domain-containing protein/prepilin-type processing-associated H-X9-DG protein